MTPLKQQISLILFSLEHTGIALTSDGVAVVVTQLTKVHWANVPVVLETLEAESWHIINIGPMYLLWWVTLYVGGYTLSQHMLYNKKLKMLHIAEHYVSRF